MKAYVSSEGDLYVESDHFHALEKFVIVPYYGHPRLLFN